MFEFLYSWIWACICLWISCRKTQTFLTLLLETSWRRFCSSCWCWVVSLPYLIVLRDIEDRGRDLEHILQQYTNLVKPAFEEFCLPVSRGHRVCYTYCSESPTSFLQTKKFADVIIPRGADNIGIILHTIAVYSASLMVAWLCLGPIKIATKFWCY